MPQTHAATWTFDSDGHPTIETPRLLLRLPGTTGDFDGDVDAVCRFCQDLDVMRFIVGRKLTRDEVTAALGRSTRYFERTKMGGFLAIRKEDGAIIGDCLLVPIPRRGVDPSDADARGPEIEVGYRFAKHAWGQGFATEAASAALAYAFAEDGGDQAVMVAVTQPANAASQRVLQKIGMRDEGLSDRFYDADHRLFTLTREAHRAQVRAATL